MTDPSREKGAAPPTIPTRVHAEAAPRAQYDPTYFQRHDARNRGRIESIMTNMSPGDRVLDVGCNRGYFSRAVLDLGLAPHVDGVEPSRSQVDPALLADPRFSLFEGDIAELAFTHRYHAVIYCAVHHHVFGHRGYVAAFELWRRIVDACDRHVFFETGHLLEGSRWYWQRELRKDFASDEEHLGALLQAVGPRLECVKVIGEHAIHGTRRWLLRVDLLPAGAASPDPRETLPLRPLEEYRRTVGNRGQELLALRDGALPEVPEGTVVHQATVFHLCEREDTGERVFCKRSLADPYKDLRELRVGSQVSDPLFVRPLALDSRFGLVFPYLEGRKLSDVDLARAGNRDAIVEQLLDLFERARSIEVVPGELDLDPRARGAARRLIDVIDLHPANVLVREDEGGALRIVGVLDLEYFRNHNEARNAKHLARLLLRSGVRTARALAFAREAARLNAAHHLRWSRASVEDRLYEKYATHPRKWMLVLREVGDELLRPLPGHFQ